MSDMDMIDMMDVVLGKKAAYDDPRNCAADLAQSRAELAAMSRRPCDEYWAEEDRRRDMDRLAARVSDLERRMSELTTLNIPTYDGGYDMAEDAAQAAMDGIRARIIETVLGEGRMEVQYALQRDWQARGLGHPGAREITAAQLAAAETQIAERLDARDAHGVTVAELLAEFAALRAQVLA